MANPGYVRSTDGSDADNGSTWALANATIAGAAADAAAGDRIWISQAHAEAPASGSAITATFPGTLASPNQIVCGSDAAEPPTSLSTAATITTSGTAAITLNGSFYWYGGTISAGTGAGNASITLAGADLYFQNFQSVKLVIACTSVAARINLGALGTGTETRVDLTDCTFKFGSTSQGIKVTNTVRIIGGSIDSAGSLPSTLFATAASSATDLVVDRFDASALGATFNWFPSLMSGVGKIVLRNCKVPASWTGGLIAGAIVSTTCRIEAYNLDSAGTNYRIWVEDYPGSILQETTIVRSGGASDGTTPLAWKMVTNANAEFPLLALASPELQIWNDTSGSSKTVTIEVVTDGVTLTDADAWLEVLYLGSSTSTLGSTASDAVSSVIASTANQTSSSVTWTTTGLTSPVKQALAVTFTPQLKGPFVCTVKLAKASTTMYVDPIATVT